MSTRHLKLAALSLIFGAIILAAQPARAGDDKIKNADEARAWVLADNKDRLKPAPISCHFCGDYLTSPGSASSNIGQLTSRPTLIDSLDGRRERKAWVRPRRSDRS